MADDVKRVSNLAETQERIRSAERRLTEIDNELITLNGELVDGNRPTGQCLTRL